MTLAGYLHMSKLSLGMAAEYNDEFIFFYDRLIHHHMMDVIITSFHIHS